MEGRPNREVLPSRKQRSAIPSRRVDVFDVRGRGGRAGALPPRHSAGTSLVLSRRSSREATRPLCWVHPARHQHWCRSPSSTAAARGRESAAGARRLRIYDLQAIWLHCLGFWWPALEATARGLKSDSWALTTRGTVSLVTSPISGDILAGLVGPYPSSGGRPRGRLQASPRRLGTGPLSAEIGTFPRCFPGRTPGPPVRAPRARMSLPGQGYRKDGSSRPCSCATFP